MKTTRPAAVPLSSSRTAGAALLVIATAQLMLVLDDTIANIALPAIQAELTMRASTLPWVINAYILAFGGLLLFGGKLGDLAGRRRVLRIGLVLFTAASVVAGLAWNPEALIIARAAQGIGAALAAPNLLALITTTYPAGAPRDKALAVYAAMSGIGITGGLLIGGVLASTLGWRSVFLINLPIGLAVLAGTRTLPESTRGTGRLDLPGAITATLGLVSLVFGITQSGENGWDAPLTLAALVVAAIALLTFVLRQRQARAPMLPLTILTDRNRAGSYLATVVIGGGLMGGFYLLTLYLQKVAGLDPLLTGLAFIPFSIGIIAGSGVGSALASRVPSRLLASAGLLLGAGGFLWLSAITPETRYLMHIAPALLLTSFGLGSSFLILTLTAVRAVPHEVVGIASSLVNTAQQVGAALGLAALTATAVAVSATSADPTSDTALSAGYSAAFVVATIAALAAAALVALTVTKETTETSPAPVA